LLALTGPAKCP